MALNIPTRPHRTEAPALPKVNTPDNHIPAIFQHNLNVCNGVKIEILGMDSRRNSKIRWWHLR